MHIITKDVRRGLVTVRAETPDDLWTLKGVIEPGDTVRGSTERKIRLGSGREEKATVVRKRVTLTLTVEKVEYTGSTLRILGTITDGPDEVPRGEHHTLVLTPHAQLTIIKDWPDYLLRRLSAARQEQPLLVLLFDREEARLFSVTRRGVEEMLRLKGVVAKKDEPRQAGTNFYKTLVAELAQRVDEKTRIIAGAPAFWREYLAAELPGELRQRTVFTTISSVERTAIRELLARPEVEKLIAEHTALQELALVEQALTALAKEQLAYGYDEVKTAIREGNAAELIVTEGFLAHARSTGRSDEVEAILRECEGVKGRVHVLTSSEACEKIDALGGIVVVRRW